MISLYIIMLVVFFSYVGFIWIKYGVQRSISDSYYRLPDKWKFLMTLFCWGFAVPAMIIGNTALMFLAGSFIAFVGVAAAFKESMTKEVHMIGAYGGVLFSQMSIMIDYGLWPISALFLLFSTTLLLFGAKNQIWWQEILAFLLICVVLGLRAL